MDKRTRIAVAGAGGRLGRHVVDVVEERGDEAVPISRTHCVDVIGGRGPADARTGSAAGVKQLVVVSIVGIDAGARG